MKKRYLLLIIVLISCLTGCGKDDAKILAENMKKIEILYSLNFFN